MPSIDKNKYNLNISSTQITNAKKNESTISIIIKNDKKGKTTQQNNNKNSKEEHRGACLRFIPPLHNI